MDIKKLQAQLKIDEGMRLDVYLDSLGFPTVGIGHLLTKKDPELQQYLIGIKANPKFKLWITQERCDQFFQQDIQNTLHDCQFIFPKFESFAEEIKQIVANMVFNLGLLRFAKFTNLIHAIRDGNFKKAAKEMQDSLWYRQVANRAKRLVARMEIFANDQLCNVKSNSNATSF